MQEPSVITNIAHVIQLAVTPIFLLTGVGSLLAVLVNRLARTVDRFRSLDAEQVRANENVLAVIRAEMKLLSKRALLIHWAIGLATSCSLMICVVIVIMFLSASLGYDWSSFISALFILAMIALIAALLLFLQEITLATSRIHLVPRH